ncbi:related to RMD1 - cytoplasmic protein required for sporulation [Pseudozyma flocculosa]|uniref:Related to RMD1 - cytoplasmic protein required for sporulation n=1 Tax=Pseudozyma flocculosa TaxID=84751 RepID=A0A5C3F9E9_9BASI|nr:related to RMD1 - cytoplasmic protein required for sporulation [Pseudozyma flocculosa]
MSLSNRRNARGSSSQGQHNPSRQNQYSSSDQQSTRYKAGPNRSSKSSSKLKILPEEPEESTSGGGTPVLPSSPLYQSGSSTMGSGHSPALSPGILRSDGSRRRYYEDGALQAVDDAAAAPSNHSHEDSSSSDVEEGEEEEQVEVYKQLAQIPEGSMRRDARRLTKRARANLPRVTAYSTATSYRMRELTKWLQARRSSHGTSVMQFDECLYTTYTYNRHESLPPPAYNGARGHAATEGGATGSAAGKVGDLLGVPELRSEQHDGQAAHDGNADGDRTLNSDEERAARREEARARRRSRFAVEGMTPELFIMDYGAIVIWGMTLAEEKRFLRELRKFEVERLASEDVESEDLHWYLADYSRIYNDVITLRRGSSYMTKLSLSHALAQSTKISFFEGIIDNTIESTKDIPQSIAESGKIGMPPAEIMKQIGHLFILRMNIHLVGSIVDSPEIFWTQPDLEPLYSAARSYLEIPQRIDLLNTRVEVLQDMLQLLKDQVTSSHSEYLEIVVILLIMLE